MEANFMTSADRADLGGLTRLAGFDSRDRATRPPQGQPSRTPSGPPDTAIRTGSYAEAGRRAIRPSHFRAGIAELAGGSVLSLLGITFQALELGYAPSAAHTIWRFAAAFNEIIRGLTTVLMTDVSYAAQAMRSWPAALAIGCVGIMLAEFQLARLHTTAGNSRRRQP